MAALGDIKKVAEHYGYECQSRQLIEEMAELTQSINKFWRKQLDCGKLKYPETKDEAAFLTDEYKSIVEEIADVEFCLDQVKLLLLCNVDVMQMKKQKIQRQLLRIESECKKGK